ncbi:MAG: CU044_2847 family protein [Aggregatilineales bacterium]
MQQTITIPIQLKSGRTIKVETSAFGGETLVSAGRDIQFNEVSQMIEEIASEFQDIMNQISPDRASIEFGVELGFESGRLTALIVKGHTKANLAIKLEWSKS